MVSRIACVSSLAALGFLLLTGCGGKPVSAAASLRTGFWVWGTPLAISSAPKVDDIYFQAGEVSEGQPPWVRIPKVLPPAQEYWAVVRSNSSRVPSKASARMLGNAAAELLGEGRARGLKVVGLQLDIDVPTRSLGAYAEWLKLAKAEMPPEMQLSVTGLLDWFRGGSAIDKVVEVVDEFVPQFYDLGDRNQGILHAIAAPVDAAKWGPIFNRFGKRYRIGVATFGRGFMVSSGDPWILNYLSPIEIASSPAFQATSRRIDTGETVVEFRATRKVRFGYLEIQPEQMIRFTLPTVESVRAGAAGAAKLGGHCAGVIFFRWPTVDETLTMQPDAVLSALRSQSGFGTRILARNGDCAMVSCEDIYLESTQPIATTETLYRIRSSAPLQYFLPDRNIAVRVAAPDRLELKLPAFCPRGQVRLGRAVSATKAQFTIEEAGAQ
jgi:hypothetical protein